jgi:Putative peptidoglycan binding domain/Caspase domain
MYSHIKVNYYISPVGGPPNAFYRWYRNRCFPLRSLAILLAALLMQPIGSLGAQASGRVALVLACEKYENFKSSAITAKWANELGQALQEHNFDVTLATDRNDAQSRALLREFSLKAEQADFALIVVSGHIVTYQGQSFYLPQNARISRATDLFSRALSLASIADIGAKARSAALFLLMTVPDIPANVAGLDARPASNGPQAANVITVFSSSSRVPVSGVDRVSEHAADKLLEAAREEPLTLAALAHGASAEGLGLVLGSVSDVNLSAPVTRPTADETSKAEMLQAAERAAKAQAEAERRARDAAMARDRAETERVATEKRLREEKERAEQAEDRARDAEQRAKQAQLQAQLEANKPRQAAAADTQSLQIVEGLIGWNERKRIQRRLQSLRLYKGKIDAVFGDQTRGAIKDFQKLSGAPETGYLTPSQLKRLVETR